MLLADLHSTDTVIFHWIVLWILKINVINLQEVEGYLVWCLPEYEVHHQYLHSQDHQHQIWWVLLVILVDLVVRRAPMITLIWKVCIYYPIQYIKNCWVRLLSNYNIKYICTIYTRLYTCLASIPRFSLRDKVTLRLLKLLF
jgi:hypothetical protein